MHRYTHKNLGSAALPCLEGAGNVKVYRQAASNNAKVT